MKSNLTSKEYIKTYKPNASLSLCNCAGIVLWLIDQDTVITAFSSGQGYKDIRRSKIIYTVSGRAYINKYRNRYYIDQFMRI